MKNKRIGILGGMGPAATSELYARVINFNEVQKDQEHVNLVILNNTKIPDRTNYILGGGNDPLPEMLNSIEELNYMKVSAIAIPCMTAHSFIEELQKHSEVPIINAIKLINENLNKQFSTIDKVGLLATDGSIKSDVYQRFIDKSIIIPNNKSQNEIMNIIYGENGIKAGNDTFKLTTRVNEVVLEMKNNGAEVIIAGCTELGLIMNSENCNLPIIDPINLLAKEIIKIYQKEIGGEKDEPVKFI